MNSRRRVWRVAFTLGFVALTAVRAQGPTNKVPPGLVLVSKVSGAATMTVDGTTTALRIDSAVPQSAKINTSLDASAVLVFSNGATTQLGAGTEVVLQEFVQEPMAHSIEISELAEEPSYSRTRIALNRGELLGTVKGLRHDRGSDFTVMTPVGAFGLRGTTFQSILSPGENAVIFTLRTLEGAVVFMPAVARPQGAGPTISGVTILAGQEITVTVSVSVNAQGQLVLNSLPSYPYIASPIPAATLRQLMLSQLNPAFDPRRPQPRLVKTVQMRPANERCRVAYCGLNPSRRPCDRSVATRSRAPSTSWRRCSWWKMKNSHPGSAVFV